MRSTGFVLLFGAALSSLPAAGGQQFPYTAYVTGNNVHVRSGPGRNYYPTDTLQRGDRVEVYRHDPGTWYAVRPPEGSFSWVSARYLEPIGDGLGRARDEQVAARVGSKFNNIRDVVQVQLNRDEVVEILDEHNGGGQTWYKIAPPSGEFRWISGRYLSPEPPGAETDGDDPQGAGDEDLPAATEQPATDEPMTSTADAQTATDAQDVQEDAPEESDDGKDRRTDANGTDRQQRRPLKTKGDRPQGWNRRGDSAQSVPWEADRPVPSSARAEQARPDGPVDRRRDSATTRPDNAPGAFSETPVATPAWPQLAALERQLSAIVVAEPATWELSEVRSAAEDLLAGADTVPQRDLARRLLGRIARFEDIQARHRQLGSGQTEVERPDPSLRVARQAAMEPTSASPFDGVGTLRPVISRKPNAPRFALVDGAGAVVSFVTPGPGVDLQPYVGCKVGVRGNRGYIREYNRTHVTARRITALEGSALR